MSVHPFARNSANANGQSAVISSTARPEGTRRAHLSRLALSLRCAGAVGAAGADAAATVAKRRWRQSKSSSYHEHSACFFRNQLIRMHAKPNSTTCEPSIVQRVSYAWHKDPSTVGTEGYTTLPGPRCSWGPDRLASKPFESTSNRNLILFIVSCRTACCSVLSLKLLVVSIDN